MRSSLPHQTKALAYCQGTPSPALFLEMRLGKTKVVIDWLRPVSGKVLVVCPLSTVRSWEEELKAEGETPPALLLGPLQARLAALNSSVKWSLVNFEGLRAAPAILAERRWAAIIVDESTRIRNPKAEVTKLLIKYAGNADRRSILSGRPDPESPLDYCEQFRFLRGDFLGFKSYWSFRNTCFFPLFGNHGWTVRPAFRQKIRDWVQKNSFVLTRKQVGLANKKFYETRTVELDPKQRKLMEKLEQEFVLETPDGLKETKWLPVKLIWMARLAGGYLDGKVWFDNKYKEFESLLSGELAKEQVVAWFRFNSEILRAEQRLNKIGISCARIDGTVDESDRAKLRKSFQLGRIQVLLCQQKVGMFGLDLSAASTAVYFSNGYSLENRIQSEDRIEHPLKKEPLLVLDLVTKDTVDEDVLKALRRKDRNSKYYLLQEIEAGIRKRTRGN